MKSMAKVNTFRRLELMKVVFILVSCAFFSKAWIDVSGSSARDVARQLREQQLMMPGYRDSDLPKALRRRRPLGSVARC